MPFPVASFPLPGALRSAIRSIVALLAACLGGQPADAADPSAEQQYWLELINHLRMDPAGELSRMVNFSSPGIWDSPKSDDPYIALALNYFGTSASVLQTQWDALSTAPPVAWSNALSGSSITYSNTMVSHDAQDHNLDGLTLEQRVENAGYGTQYLDLGETLYAAAQNALHGHAAFAIDWGDSDGNPGNGFGSGIQNPTDHRDILMDAVFKEAGIGFQSIAIPGANTVATGPLVVTQHFGNRFRWTGSQYVADAILTGVVFGETVLMDDFYTPGEGWSGTSIFVYDVATNNLVASGATNSAGGFNIDLGGLQAQHLYRVEAPATGLAGQEFSISSHVEDYGAPVTFFDNVYASFQVVPEPGSALLALLGAVVLGTRRRRARIRGVA